VLACIVGTLRREFKLPGVQEIFYDAAQSGAPMHETCLQVLAHYKTMFAGFGTNYKTMFAGFSTNYKT